MIINNQAKSYLIIIGILIICAIPLFIDIGKIPIIVWDESRNANNAIEMYQNHNYIVRYYDGNPDMWEVKPPMLIWFQVLSFNIFGISEFALRLPVIISILILLFSIMFFFKREFNLLPVGIISSLVIITSSGFVDRHIGRTGDHDGVLILWLTLCILNFYRYCDTEKRKYIYYTALFILFAVFTKSIIGFSILPGLFLYAFYKNKIIKLLKSKELYFSLIVSIGFILTYYLLRESYSPGYLKTVWEQELYRYAGKGEFKSETLFWYYLENFSNGRFMPWLYLLFLSIPTFFILNNKKSKDLFVVLHILLITIFIIISKGCKNLWYDAPLYPIMAMIIGINIWAIFNCIFPWKALVNIVLFIVIVLIFIDPYSKIIKHVLRENEKYRSAPEYIISYYLKEKNASINWNKKLILCTNYYSAHLLFYKQYYKLKGNDNLIIKNTSELIPGEIVLVSESEAKDIISKKYNYIQSDSLLLARVIKITGLKDQNIKQ